MFNSLKYAKQLMKAGFTAEQADTQMQIMTDLLETKLATKQDLKDLEVNIKSVMDSKFASFEKSMVEMELRIQRNLTGIMAALLTAAVALNKFL